LFNFASAVARPSGSDARHLAKPPPRYMPFLDSALNKRTLSKKTGKTTKTENKTICQVSFAVFALLTPQN